LNEELCHTASKQVVDTYYNAMFGAKEDQPEDPNRAELGMVKQLVEALDTDKSGVLSRHEIKSLFSKLSGVHISEIDDQHPEVIRFSDLTTGELTHKLHQEASRDKIESFHEACGLVYVPDDSILNPRADRAMVIRVVHELDKDGDGTLSIQEIQRLFSTLSGLPLESVPADSPEVEAFAGLTTEKLIEKLWTEVPQSAIQFYHAALFGHEEEDSSFARASPPEASIAYSEADSMQREAVVDHLLASLGLKDGLEMEPMSAEEVPVYLGAVLRVPADSFNPSMDNHELVLLARVSLRDALERIVTAVPEIVLSSYAHTVLVNETRQRAELRTTVDAMPEGTACRVAMQAELTAMEHTVVGLAKATARTPACAAENTTNAAAGRGKWEDVKEHIHTIPTVRRRAQQAAQLAKAEVNTHRQATVDLGAAVAAMREGPEKDAVQAELASMEESLVGLEKAFEAASEEAHVEVMSEAKDGLNAAHADFLEAEQGLQAAQRAFEAMPEGKSKEHEREALEHADAVVEARKLYAAAKKKQADKVASSRGGGLHA